MWCGKRVSLILPTYNEKESIRASIEEFEREGVIDEILVVNNNAAPGTSEEVAKTGAREVLEPQPGLRRCDPARLPRSDGELILVSEPDGTFRSHDVRKLLAYSEDFEVVYGSRTVKELIWEGANMGLFLKWGNYAVAKLMEFLFNTTSLTDVGCTVRCVRRDALRRIEPFFTVDGSFFGPEMMVLSVLTKRTIIQIPVNYTKRVGTSSVTGNKWVAFRLGLRMIWLVLDYRVRSWLAPSRFEPRSRAAPRRSRHRGDWTKRRRTAVSVEPGSAVHSRTRQAACAPQLRAAASGDARCLRTCFACGSCGAPLCRALDNPRFRGSGRLPRARTRASDSAASGAPELRGRALEVAEAPAPSLGAPSSTSSGSRRSST